MDSIATAFERLALLLRPIGVALGIIAVLLFLGINLDTQIFDGWRIDLAMLWTGGLAMLIYWFKPGRSGPGAMEVMPSAARRYGKAMQYYVTIFFLLWLAFAAVATLLHWREFG